MKQWLILIIAIALVVFGGIFEICYLERTSRYLLADVSYSKQALETENYNLAKDHYEALNSTWNNLKKVWSIYVDHDEIEDMDKSMLEYNVYLDKEDEEDAYTSVCEIQRKINHIVEKQQIHVGNIF